MIAFPDGEALHCPIKGRDEGLLSFHGFEDEDLLALRDLVALGCKDIDDLAGHWGSEFAGADNTGAGSRASGFDLVDAAFVRDGHFVARANRDGRERPVWPVHDHSIRELGDFSDIWVEFNLFPIDEPSQRAATMDFLAA